MDLPKVSKEIFDRNSMLKLELAQIFPNVIKDGEIDFNILKSELEGTPLKSNDSKYQLNWAGKSHANLIANENTQGLTLKILQEDSKNLESTENIYIQGDNLKVLQLLRQNYYNTIKMIYIDPPYNTGKDFVYSDNFHMSNAEAEEIDGSRLDGERLILNQKNGNKYHANWLNMMYPRLKVARDLLKDDGLIFISIDENEQFNLRVICNEIFYEENFVCEFIWQNKKGGGNDSIHVAVEHEYILCYAKNKSSLNEFYQAYSAEYLKRYKEEDSEGKFYWDTFKRKSGKQYYPIICPDGTVLEKDALGNPISWLRSEKRFIEDKEKGEVKFVQHNGQWSVHFKQRLPKGKKPRSIFTTETVISDKGTTSTGSTDVLNLFGMEVFSNPKPIALIEYFLGFGVGENDYVLDFFSGSGTTAEAVMRANSLDDGNRKFIAVQIEEDLKAMLESTPSNRQLPLKNAISILEEINKPLNIAELGKERIKRAANRIEKSNSNIDTGFKVFKIAETNIRWTHEALTEGQIAADEAEMTDKDKLDFMLGTKDIDVVYEVMLRQRDVPLSSSVELLSHIGPRTYMFADSYVVCLEEDITEELVEKLAAIDPLPIKYVLRDSAFGENISLKEETFRRLQLLVERNTGVSKKTYTVEFL